MKNRILKTLSILLFAFVAFAMNASGHTIIDNSNPEVITASIFSASIAQDRARQVAKVLRSNFKEFSIEMAYLFAEQTMVNTSGQYTFDFRVSAGVSNNVTSPNQLLLDQSDVFIVTQLGMFNYEKNSTTAAYIRGGLQTNINPEYYTTTAGFTKDHLNQIYAGKLAFHVGNTDQFQNLDTGLLNFGHQLQGDLANDIYQGRNGDSDGYYTLPELMVFNGSADAYIKLNFNLFTGIQIANTGANLLNQVVFKPQGILVRGGAGSQAQIIELIKNID